MNNKIVETKNLSKTFKRYKKQAGLKGSIVGLWKREYEEKRAVNEVDITIEEGEFIGLIGPNGAGKTTLIKMLTGIIAPSGGEIQVLGFYPNEMKNEFKKQYAVVMGQKSQLFFELTVNDTLRLFKEIYEIPEKEFITNKEYFAELFGVKELMDVQVRTLSLGERMKMEIIVALLHNPKILFLDEPTIGLDAIASKQIRKFLREVNEEKGTTIILTSHYMEDIKALCKRSIVVNHGVKIYDGSTEDLFEKYQLSKRITITFDKPLQDLKFDVSGTELIEDNPFKKILMVPKDKANELLAAVMQYEPSDISVEEEEVGTVVERIYQEGSGAGA